MFVFMEAERRDAIKPNEVRVLRAQEWAYCHPDYTGAGARNGGSESQLDCFLAQPEALAYPRFNAGVYSVDTLLPIVSMEMQGFWNPDDSTPFGYAARWFLWLQIAMGWALSLLAVAGFSGLIKSDSGSV